MITTSNHTLSKKDIPRLLYRCYTVQEKSKRKSETQDGGFVKSATHISACTHDNNGIPTDIPLFSEKGYNTEKQVGILCLGAS